MKTVSHDARTAIINEYDVPVGRLRVECAVPHRRACRHRHPQSAFAIPQYEVRLADGHAIEGIQQHICLARPRHYLKSVSSEVRSEEHMSELQSLMRISYAVFCLKKKK